jgi:hypothetical protein
MEGRGLVSPVQPGGNAPLSTGKLYEFLINRLLLSYADVALIKPRLWRPERETR